MGMKLEGQTAVITGSGSGIGQNTAVRFVSEGANVLVVDKRGGCDAEMRVPLLHLWESRLYKYSAAKRPRQSTTGT